MARRARDTITWTVPADDGAAGLVAAQALAQACADPGTPDDPEEIAALERLAVEIDARAAAAGALADRWGEITLPALAAFGAARDAARAYAATAERLRAAIPATMPAAAPTLPQDAPSGAEGAGGGELPAAQPSQPAADGLRVAAVDLALADGGDSGDRVGMAGSGTVARAVSPAPRGANQRWPLFRVRDPDLVPPEYRVPDGDGRIDLHAIASADGDPPQIPGVEFLRLGDVS